MTQEKEEKQMENQEEEQEGLGANLEAILELTPDSPLDLPMPGGRKLLLTKEQFMAYYLPKDASREEKFHCFNQTRAAGLSPLIQGECHYFRTGDRPLSLYTGYPVYLRKAYANGLEHIAKPDIEFNEDGKPVSCTITLTIKDRELFIWTTWFDEVALRTKGGQLNSRWTKAPIFQFIKCSSVNTFRFSGIVDFALPYIIEEMDDPIAAGYRTLTQSQLDAHAEQEEEASAGVVDAASHQVDMRPFRMKYFGMIEEIGILQDEELRQNFQERITGKRHLGDMDTEDYVKLFEAVIADRIHLGKSHAGVIKPEDTEAEEVESDPHYHPEAESGEMIGAKTAEEQQDDTQKDESAIEPSVALGLFVTEAEARFKTQDARDNWIRTAVSDKPMDEWSVSECALATEALMKLPEIPTEDPPTNTQKDAQEPASGPMTTATLDKIREALGEFQDRKYQTMRSVAFKEFATKAIGRDDIIPTLTNCNEAEALKILAALRAEKDEIAFAALGKDGQNKSSAHPVHPDSDQYFCSAHPVLCDKGFRMAGKKMICNSCGAPAKEKEDDKQKDEPDFVEIYIEKRRLRFPDYSQWNKWEGENELPSGSIAKWEDGDLKRGIALLEFVTPLDQVPDDTSELMTQDQFDRIGAAVEVLPYRNVGSEMFRKRVAEILGGKYEPIRGLSLEDGEDLTLAFEDELQDFQEKRGRYAPAVM